MAISQFSPSKPSQDDPSSKLKQRKTSDFKKKPMGSQYNTTKKEETHNIAKPILSNKKSMERSCGISSAVDRANEVQANLPSIFPSCVKYMLRSHVTGGFWLSLPKQFCDLHLPKKDDIVVLVDENDQEYKTKYLVEKNGLSGGWRGFSIAHNLLEGDVLVFQLIKPCVLKVYIVRGNGLTEIDGAVGLLNLDFRAKSVSNAKIKEGTEDVKNIKTERQDYSEPPADVPEKCIVAVTQSASENDDLNPEVLDGIRFSETDLEFKDVKGFECFNILVDGLIIDSEIPLHLRTKYYQLCCSQNSFLHGNLVKGLNCKLAAGIISETVNIADAIRAAKLNSSFEFLPTWDKTLKAFEDMGMAVGFLRDRIKMLLSLPCKQRGIIQSKTNEKAQLEEEMRSLVTKLMNVKEAIKSLDAEIKVLEFQHEHLEQKFKEKANAPW